MTQAFNLSQLANGVNTSGQINAATTLYNQVPVVNGGTALSSAGAAGNMLLATSASTYSSVSIPTFGFRNRIINGAMVIDQRNAGASVIPTDGQYTLDRWTGNAGVASKYSVQQNAGSITPPSGFINYLGVTSLSAYSVGSLESFTIRQGIEGFNLTDLGWGTSNAQTVILSFWIRSSLTGTFGGSLRNSATNRSYPFTYTVSAANTWEYKNITIAGDTSGTWLTNNGAGIYLSFGFGVGSTFSGSAGSWAAANYISATGATSVVGTNGATFYITGVQLEKGSIATSFDYRPYGTELALCQRYYGSYGAAAFVYPVNGAFNSFQFKVSMRATPTVTLSTGTLSGVTNDGFHSSNAAVSSCSVTASAEL